MPEYREEVNLKMIQNRQQPDSGCPEARRSLTSLMEAKAITPYHDLT